MQANVPFIERDLRRERLSEADLRALLGDQPPSTIYARRAHQNKVLGLDPDQLGEEDMLSLMAREPTLIRRPVVVVDGKVYAGANARQIKLLLPSLESG